MKTVQRIVTKDWSYDVWYDDDQQIDCYSLKEMFALMRKFRKEGKQSIRAYSYEQQTGESWYYNFDKNGRIRKETNNFDN